MGTLANTMKTDTQLREEIEGLRSLTTAQLKRSPARTVCKLILERSPRLKLIIGVWATAAIRKRQRLVSGGPSRTSFSRAWRRLSSRF